jgi:hypothetical protein
MTPEELVGSPSPESPTAGQDGGMAQPPADGFVRPAQQAQQPDPLMDDKALKAAALDHRGSRQIAPYGTYEAVDAAIQHGYYTGLEALDFGTLPDGTPAALFTDQRGQRQAIRMSQEQWSAGLQTRAQARIAMAKQMRNQQESQRLMPAVEKMAQELETAAPGFMDYAAMNMENDPRGTYSMVQSMYDKFKAGDKQVMREMAKASDQASLQVGQAQAESWAKNKNEMLTTQAEGIMDDDSIPEEFKAQYLQDLRRKMASNSRFAYLTPPVGGIRRTASFPSWYASQSNPGAIDDLADTTITDVGYQNIAQLPRPQQIQFLMQRSMAISREIGWSMPFGQADIAMVSNALDRRLQAMSPPPMMQPNQVAGNQAPEAQQIRGTMSQMQRGQQEREQATRQTEAKIAETEARAMFGANRAEYAPQMSEAELAQKQANTGLTQARATTAQVDAQYAAARQQARIAEMRARAAQGDAESERKLAEVDVLLGLTPEEAKSAKTQRETERKSRSTQPSAGIQQSSKDITDQSNVSSGSAKEREQRIRTLSERYGVTMDNTGNIREDVISTTNRLANDKTMIGKMRYKSWIKVGSILADEK